MLAPAWPRVPGLLTAAFLAGNLGSCAKPPAATAGSAVAVAVAPVGQRDVPVTEEWVASLYGLVDAQIRVQVSVRKAVATYPYAGSYHVWPGPNSNTFTAHVLRAVPELQVDMPANAVGKDYLGRRLVAKTPSGTGGQFNLFGAAGLLVDWEEGVEINVAGLNFGVNPRHLVLKLPLIGNLGPGGRVEPRTVAPRIAGAGH